MIVWTAGTIGSDAYYDYLRNISDHYLISFHYQKTGDFDRVLCEKKNFLFVDSGAFSAWTAQMEIPLKSYIDFCLNIQNKATLMASMDVIPGEFGRKGTFEEREISASKGWRNYKRMLSKGVDKSKLIHIFHQDEDFKWLELMVKECAYIGLSPANDRTTEQKVQWLDKCMEYVLDEKGLPKIKFHGFAVTSWRIMRRYPWYSVDSSSWMVHARYGTIIIPRKVKGSYDYIRRDPYLIFASSKSPTQKDPQLKHLDVVKQKSPALYKQIVEYLEYVGIPFGEVRIQARPKNHKLELCETWMDTRQQRKEAWKKDPGKLLKTQIIIEPGILNCTRMRSLLNLHYYKEFGRQTPEWPWAFRQYRQSVGGIFS